MQKLNQIPKRMAVVFEAVLKTVPEKQNNGDEDDDDAIQLRTTSSSP